MYKITGVIKRIDSTKQISDKFRKRDFVIADGGMYPNIIQFQCVNDHCSLLDNINEFDDVEITFSVKGREWTNAQGVVTVFNALEATNIAIIEKTKAMTPNQSFDESPKPIVDPNDSAQLENDYNDDLPF